MNQKKLQKSLKLAESEKKLENQKYQTEKIETLSKENLELKSKITALDTQSLSLKNEFSILLDKFKDLVNTSESQK